MIKLSVIIPTRGRPHLLQNVLRSIRNDPLPKEHYELLIAEDQKESQLRGMLAQFQDLPLHHFLAGGRGPAAARNQAIQKARGEILLFLDDDVEPASPLLSGHLDFHRHHPRSGDAALGQVVLHPDIPMNAFRAWVERYGPQFAYAKLRPGAIVSGRYFYTAQVSVKRILLERERFDPTFPYPSYEDLDLGLRLEKCCGLRLHYRPELLAFHHAPYSLKGYRDRAWRVGVSRRYFIQKHPEERRLVERLPGGIPMTLRLLRVMDTLLFPLAKWAEPRPPSWAAVLRPVFHVAYRRPFFEGYRQPIS